MQIEEVTAKIREIMHEVANADSQDSADVEVTADTPLIGDGSVLDSMKLVELCLALEDFADELGFEFDWTSDSAMSKSRSMFRTAGSLTSEFLQQMGASS